MRSMKYKIAIYITFLIINILIFINNFRKQSQWAYDVIFVIVLVSIILLISKKTKITPEGFFLICGGFLLHNFGSFGWYGKTIGPFGYDDLVHFFGSLAAAYVLFNFISRRLHARKNKVEENGVEDNKLLLILLVIALVSMLGVCVELIEFGGFLYLGEGEGMFFVGVGDVSHEGGGIAGQYVDTMQDIFVNMVGSIVGVTLFYHLRFKKKHWISYQ